MGCPDDQALLAVLESTVDPARFGELEVHIDGCPRCRKVMAALAIGSPSPSIPHRPFAGIEPELAPGTTIHDRYVVTSELGRGGMGTVYLAHDRTLGRDVALKLHLAGSSADRLHREAIAMAKLAHPNVVTVFEVATVDDRLFVAMEYVRGTTLRGWRSATPRSWRETVRMLVEAGRGLAAAHAAGLVHRDFKPENVLVGEDRRPRVGDFGLARTERHSAPKLADGDQLATANTMTAGLAGTPAYMAPEQLAGDPVDARSDQFAFAVVAWECLYGARPFIGKTLAELHLAIERHELKPSSLVPDRVRRVIARGLATAPEARWPDMPAMLAALERAAASRTRRNVIATAIAAGVIATGAYAVYAEVAPKEPVCAVPADALAGAFDPAVQARIHAAFVKADPAGGERMFARVQRALDAYAGSWVAMRHDACEATRVRGDQSEALLDLRMMCLDRRRDELRALTTGFADADRKVVLSSIQAALGLTGISGCADATALTAPVAPPGLLMRDLVEAQRDDLAKAKGLRLLGRVEPALEVARGVVARAKQLAYPPLEAEALLDTGDLMDRLGDSAGAIATLQQAIVAADAGRHVLVAAQAWSTLAWIQGYENHELDRARWAIQMAGASIKSLGGNAELSIQLANYEGLVLDTHGDLEAARAKLAEALAARERLGSRDDWRIAILLNDLGSVERKLGHYKEAIAHHQRALAIRTQTFGELHPYVFSSLNNLGNVAWSQQDYEQAVTWFRKAQAVGEAIFPPHHPQIALVLGNLGSALEDEGKAGEAVEAFRRVVSIYEATRGPTHPDVAEALDDLGNALVELGKLDEATRAYQRALAILDTPGNDDPSLVRLLRDDAALLANQDPVAAERLLGRAIAIEEKARGATPDLGKLLAAHGELQAAMHRPADAARSLERAVQLEDVPSVAPEDRAGGEFALAKLLWEAPATRHRAIELATSARGRLEHVATRRDRHDTIDRWLREHPGE